MECNKTLIIKDYMILFIPDLLEIIIILADLSHRVPNLWIPFLLKNNIITHTSFSIIKHIRMNHINTS
jgi:hypothetical protein